MHAENLLVDDGCDGEAVETVDEGLPELDVVSPFALVVESYECKIVCECTCVRAFCACECMLMCGLHV